MATEETSETTSVQLGTVAIRFVHADSTSPYSLIEWIAPAGAPSPPVHVHHCTDEGFYVLTGSYGFLLDGERIEVPAGEHVLVPKGKPHTFWNASGETSGCLVLISPAGFEQYFRELAEGLAATESDEAAMELRRQLSSRYDIEVVGPPVEL